MTLSRLLLFASLLFLLLIVAACTNDSECAVDSDCPEGMRCARSSSASGAVGLCVRRMDPNNEDHNQNNFFHNEGGDMCCPAFFDMPPGPDLGPEDGMPRDMPMEEDIPQVDGCMPMSTQELCAANDAECGQIIATDNCASERTPNCGSCAPDLDCVGNQCVCLPESDPDFCARHNAECGSFTGLDNCMEERTIVCGECSRDSLPICLECDPQDTCGPGTQSCMQQTYSCQENQCVMSTNNFNRDCNANCANSGDCCVNESSFNICCEPGYTCCPAGFNCWLNDESTECLL